MQTLKFSKELYAKTALIKAAYNFTDSAYLHLDADDKYFIVNYESKDNSNEITENDFLNEMLAQSVRHEVYMQTKNIRELIFARAMATSVVSEKSIENEAVDNSFNENEILKDWFLNND